MTASSPSNITTQNGSRFDTSMGDLIRALTEYAMHASEKQLARQMRLAYPDHGPDSQRRWVEHQAAWESLAQDIRSRKAWKFYRRVHGEPSPAEQARLAFEAEFKNRYSGHGVTR